MTHEDCFQTLLQWAWTFGCDIIEANEEAWPEDKKESRGLFRKGKRESEGEVMEIWLKMDLTLEDKIGVMGHEVAHLALHLLNVNPDQKIIREPVADLLGKCLVATLWEDWQNPLLRVGGIVELVKNFLEFLKAKKERTQPYLAWVDAEYFRWKREVEGDRMDGGGIGG
jgi:hypothetical protein